MRKSNKKGWPFILSYGLLGLVLSSAGCSGNQEGHTQDTTKQTTTQEREEKPPQEKQEPVLTGNLLAGKQVFEQYCLTCHQADGGGVPSLNPPLTGTEYVLGDKERLVGIVLKGSNVGLEVDGETFSNAMPPHDFLSDEQVAQVLSYVRNSFGNKADTLSAAEVATIRKKLKK